MNSTIGWIALGVAVLLVLWALTADGRQAMETCQQTHSTDVCWVSLNP